MLKKEQKKNYKKEQICPAYVSKHNPNPEKHAILVITSNGEQCEAKSKWQRLWHYLAVKKLSALLRRSTSRNNCDFYCLNCLYYFKTKANWIA